MKAGVAAPENTSITRERNSKHVSAVTNNHAKTEELLEAVFSMLSVPRLYKKNQWEFLVWSRVEASSTTTTVALRVVGGDEKGTQYLGV
jgi:hypothetical protein